MSTPESRSEMHVDNTKNAQIWVREVKLADDELYAAAMDGSWVKLGSRTAAERNTEYTYLKLLTIAKNHATQMFLLSWNGTRVPRGAQINGIEIAWTQNGIATSSDGKPLAYYERLMDSSGENGKEQQMIVFVKPESAGKEKN